MYTPITDKKIEEIKIRDAIRAVIYGCGLVSEGKETEAQRTIEKLAECFESDLTPLREENLRQGEEIERLRGSLFSERQSFQWQCESIDEWIERLREANPNFLKEKKPSTSAVFDWVGEEIERLRLEKRITELRLERTDLALKLSFLDDQHPEREEIHASDKQLQAELRQLMHPETTFNQ